MIRFKTFPYTLFLPAVFFVFLAACSERSEDSSQEKEIGPTERIVDSDSSPQNWLSYGRSYNEQRHSPLTGINKENLDQLRPAWIYEMRRTRGVEATPLIVDGVIYVTGSWSIVYALDAKTGEELWVHDPQVPGEAALKGCCGVVNRGVAVYEDKVFAGTFDGRLQALDSKTGAVLWSVVTVDQSKPYTITGAPRVAKGLVFIGNGGAEFGVRGYLSAYDVNTGELVWRFYTTPNPEKTADGAASDEIFVEIANDTWGDVGAWTSVGGGGTVWDSIVYDQVNDSIIFGTGNGSPWNDKIRDPQSDGDNLFLSSIVAVDASTGAYKWHFQSTPREKWDYTATQQIMLAELPLGENGAPRRVVMQAPKNGFFYVLDAATGAFIHADTLGPINWADGLDENGRPNVTEAARNTDNGAFVIPGSHGMHNWHPMAFNPHTGLVYLPTHSTSLFYKDAQIEEAVGASQTIGYDVTAPITADYAPGVIDAIRATRGGALTAWDPVANKLAWQKPLKTGDNSGVLSTADGLIFQGGIDGKFHAYDAETGDHLWEANIENGMMGGASTYEVDGEQYIVLGTGHGGAYSLVFGLDLEAPVKSAPGRIIAFKVGGEATIPPVEVLPVDPTPKADRFGGPDMINLGLNRYANFCSGCHGSLAISGGVTPDLRWSYVASNKDSWDAVMIDGALTDNGMVSFANILQPDEIEAIRAYVIDQGHLAVRNREAFAETTPSDQ